MTQESQTKISNVDQLLAVLTEDLGYCGCGYYQESIKTLRDVLQFAYDRQAAVKDSEKFSSVTREVDKWRLTSPGLTTWFVWLLDKHGYISHNFNPSDIWITDKGTAILGAIKNYYSFSGD